nr:hypothetical protein [Bacillus amyloliquefaciens]
MRNLPSKTYSSTDCIAPWPPDDGSSRFGRSFSCSSSPRALPSPRDASPDRLCCPGRLSGLPETAALLQLQFFAAGAAIAQGCGPRSPVLPWPPVRSSGSCRAPSAAVLHRGRCHRPGMRAPIACVALAACPIFRILPRSFSCSSSPRALPSPRDASPDRLCCPGRLSGLPDPAALLQLQLFAAGAESPRDAERRSPTLPWRFFRIWPRSFSCSSSPRALPSPRDAERRSPTLPWRFFRIWPRSFRYSSSLPMQNRPGMRAPIACVALAACPVFRILPRSFSCSSSLPVQNHPGMPDVDRPRCPGGSSGSGRTPSAAVLPAGTV